MIKWIQGKLHSLETIELIAMFFPVFIALGVVAFIVWHITYQEQVISFFARPLSEFTTYDVWVIVVIHAFLSRSNKK